MTTEQLTSDALDEYIRLIEIYGALKAKYEQEDCEMKISSVIEDTGIHFDPNSILHATMGYLEELVKIKTT